MNETIVSLRTNFLATGQIFVLGSIGFYVLKRGILGECCLRTISNLVLDVTLPCFIFTNIIMNFDKVRGDAWYLFPVFCMALILVSFGVGMALSLISPARENRREFVLMTTFQNSGFLPIILVTALLPAEMAGKIYVYIFMFILVFAPLLFSLTDIIYNPSAGIISGLKSLANPASAATICALAVSAMRLNGVVPDLIMTPLSMLGAATIPLSMIVIGGIVMVNYSKNVVMNTGLILQASATRLIIIPLLVYALLQLVRLPMEMEYLIALEAMMPPAVTLPLLAKKHGGDSMVVSQGLFGITILSLFTIPLLLTFLNISP